MRLTEHLLQQTDPTVDKVECLNRAEGYLKHALVIKESTSRDKTDFLYIALTLENLAQVYRLQNRLSEAEALLRKALAIRESKEGKDSARCASTYLFLGDVLTANSLYFEAQKEYEKSLSIYTKTNPPEDAVLGVCHHRMFLMFYGWNKLARAGEQYDLAVKIFKKHSPTTSRNLTKLIAEVPLFPQEAYAQALKELTQNSGKTNPEIPVQISLLRNQIAAARRVGAPPSEVSMLEQKLRELTNGRN